MDVKVVLDWKSFLALGGSIVAVILASKLDHDAAERALTSLVNAGKELAIARTSNR